MKKLQKHEGVESAVLKMIPVPRVLSSSCGTALQVQHEHFTAEYMSGLDYDSLFEWIEQERYAKIE